MSLFSILPFISLAVSTVGNWDVHGELVYTEPPGDYVWWRRHRLQAEVTDNHYTCEACRRRFSREELFGAGQVPKCRVRPRDLVPEPDLSHTARRPTTRAS